MSNKLKNILLLFTSIIWGTAFTYQSIAGIYLKPFTFVFLRFFISAVFLFLIILLRKGLKLESKYNKKDTIKGGIICGIVLFLGTSFQQIGLVGTSPGKAGFISALYIVFVPILAIFVGKMPEPKTWLAIAVAVLGLYFLCFDGNFSISYYDLVLIASAFIYAIHILAIDKYCKNTDLIRLNAMQFLVLCVLGFFASCVFENFDVSGAKYCMFPILFSAILSGGVAYYLQSVGQKDNNPTIASLIMSLESVFSVVSSYIILNSLLSMKEILGCVLIFAAVLTVVIESKKRT